MAFSLGSLGKITEQLTNAVSDAFGLGSNENKPDGALFDPAFFGSVQFDASKWSGNGYVGAGRKPLRYGFVILESNGTGTLKIAGSTPYYLQIPPQNIQQKELFATNVQATRKGVIVESEGVVFKDIVLSGTTGIFPGERAAGTNVVPNISNPTAPPGPPAGLDPKTGKSQRSGVATISGYQEFLSLRQYFLKYAKLKVEGNGKHFFGFINEKDNQYLIVEPLEFTMERSVRSPLTYDYRIVLKAIGSLDDTTGDNSSNSEIELLDQIINVSANISATLGAAKNVIDAGTGTLISLTQALDNVFITPFRQLKLAVDSINSGTATILSIPSTLLSNFKATSKITLAVAEQRSTGQNSTVLFSANFASTPLAATALTSTTDSFGNVNNTGPTNTSTSNSPNTSNQTTEESNILNPDGSLSLTLTSQQYLQVVDILDQLDNDTVTPVPRSFVEELRNNTILLRNNLADSVGLGSSAYDDILGRTVTSPAPPLTVPSDSDFQLLGALSDVIGALNKILCNNEFFQAGADIIFDNAQLTYSQVANISKPVSVRQVEVRYGDSLELIALRELGNALRWPDLVVLNNLRAPYILDDVVLKKPEGTLMPGENILIGVR